MFALELLMLFLPILAGNQMGYVGRWNWPLGTMPVSTRWLGGHKTIGALYAGPLFAAITLSIESLFAWPREFFGVAGQLEAAKVGGCIGFGVVCADQMNSFLKRRLRFTPGHPFFTDRIDWILGGGGVVLGMCPQVRWWHVLSLACIGIPIHIFGNRHSFSRGWRNTPH